MVHNKVGQYVTGPDFFDREREERAIWEAIKTDDILLLAPRRVGKTSLMMRLRDNAAQHGAEAAYLSVQGAETEIQFVERLYAAMAELKTAQTVLRRLSTGPLSKLFKRIRKVEAFMISLELEGLDPTPERRWVLAGQALVEALDEQAGQTLMLVDELPVFVLALLRSDPSGDRARRFLSWFRELRQRPSRHGRLHWLLAGSIGLDTVAARLNLGDTINDLYSTSLGAFDREVADRFLQALAATYSFDLPTEVREHAMDRVGWLIPFHLQLLFRELKKHCEDRGCKASPATVDEVIEEVLSPTRKGYFDYWRQRLHEELGKPDAGYAIAMLNQVAQDPTGVERASLRQLLAQHLHDAPAREERLRFLLDVLESDGYLVVSNERYMFRSPLLREFWLRRVMP